MGSFRSCRWLLALALSISSLQAERSVEEWNEVLVKRYNALGSFRATYTAVSQDAEEPMRGFLIEERKSGASLAMVHSEESGGGSMWAVPDAEGNVLTYGSSGEHTFRARGMVELMIALDEIAYFEREQPKSKRRQNGVPCISLSPTHISVLVVAIRDNVMPWFEKSMREQVEEIREKDLVVEFILEDGSWIHLQKETGLLAERGHPVEVKERKLVLEAVQPLSGMKEFNRELPQFDPKAVQELPIGVIPAAGSMHHLLLHSLLDLLRDEKNPVTIADLEERYTEKFDAYWKAAWGNGDPPGIPAALLKLRNIPTLKKDLRPAYEQLRKDRPITTKDLTFPQFVDQQRKLAAIQVQKDLVDNAGQLPTVALVENSCRAMQADLPPHEEKLGDELAAFLKRSQLKAILRHLFPPLDE